MSEINEFRQKLDDMLVDSSSFEDFSFELFYPGGNEGVIFVQLLKESEGLLIKHSCPPTIFGPRDKEALSSLAGTEHRCEPRYNVLSVEMSKQEYEANYEVRCETRSIRFVELGKKTVHIEVEIALIPEPSDLHSGRPGDREVDQRTLVSREQTVVIQAKSEFSELQKVYQKFFKALAAPKKFPTELLKIARMDALTPGGSSSAWEIGFDEYQLGTQTCRPYLIMQDGPALPAGTMADLQGKKFEFAGKNRPEGQIYDLYPGGRPFVEMLGLSFGKLKGKTIDCVVELKLGLADIAKHNPDHRYKDATCKLKTKISVAP